MNIKYQNRVPNALILACALFTTAALASETGGLKTLRGPQPAIANGTAPEIHQHLDQEMVTRNYAQQPPLIPHRIRNYKINLRSNKCLTCHHPDHAYAVNAPPVPPSHFVDRDGNKLQHVSARRYFCVQCHVPQDGVVPLVANTFTPARVVPTPRKP